MEEDTVQFCTNCKRHVASSNFAIHSAFCERNIYVCRMCGEPVPISEKNQHLEDYHVISPCDLCETSLEKWMLPKHMESCTKRPVACEYCEADFPFDEFSQHVNFCGSRTEKCLVCQKYVMIKEKDKHDKLHAFEKKFHTKDLEEEIKQNKVNEVISDSSTAEKISDTMSKHYTQCHICKQTVPWIDFNTHLPVCAISSGKFSSCGEVPSYALKGHMKEDSQGRMQKPPFKVPQNIDSCSKTTSNSDESYAGKSKEEAAVKICPFCSQQFFYRQILEHIRICPKNVYECPLCCEKVFEIDRVKHETTDCKMLQENTEPDRPSFSSSAQMVFECPLCGEDIPEENRDRHLSFECKKLFDSNETQSLYAVGNSTPNIYECIYCSEKMPEKEKAMHQAFHCKVLIENSGLNIYDNRNFSHSLDSESYAEVTKKTCKANCKCHPSAEICPTCKNRIPKQKMLEHMSSCQRLKLPCLHCNQLIDPACEGIHIGFCPALNGDKKSTDLKSRVSENSRFSNYEYKGAIPKNSSIRDMMKPRSAKCKFCQTTLNADILKFHEDECIHKPVQCPTCLKEILMKDTNTHKCKRKKGKGKNQKMEQQTQEKEEPGLLEWTKNFFKFSNEKKEDKDQYRALQHPNYYADHRPVPGNVNRENLYFEQRDNTLLPCEFCQVEFPAFELVLHETGCQPGLVSYAKQDSESNLNKSSSRQDYGSLPSNVGPVKKDSTSTQNIYKSGMSNSFFPGKNSNVLSATYEHIENKKSSEVRPGEFLQPYYNKSLLEHHENPKQEENAEKEKKTERVKVQSLWNAGSSNDDLKGISDYSDAEMDVDQTEEINCVNDKEKESSKELEGHVPEKPFLYDNEMADMLNFLKTGESIEFDDEREPKNSGTEVCRVLGLKGNTQEKHQRDSPMTKKTAIEEECEKMGQEISKLMDSRVNNPEEYATKHLANFKFGASKSTVFSDENKAHCAVQSKSFEVQEKLHKQKASKYIEMSEDQRDQVRNVRHLPDLKHDRCGSASFPGEDVDQIKEKNGEELKDMYKLKFTKCNESSKDQREYVNSFKHLENFKFGAYKSTDMPKKEKMLFPVRPEKNDSDQEKLCEQKSPKCSDHAKVQEEYAHNLKHLANFKYNIHDSATLFGEENKFCKVLPAKNKEEPENSYHKTSRYVDSKIVDKEYLRNFRQHLPDFKFGVLETKSEENGHNTILSEKRNGYGERAFNVEPDLHVSSRTTIDKNSKNVYKESSGHIGDSKKGNEKCVINIKYSSDKKFDAHAKSHEDKVRGEKSAFTLEAAGLLLKETKFSTDTVMSKEKKGIERLEEKIAALTTRNLRTDYENDDVAKWQRWRSRRPDDSSDGD